VLRFNLTSVQVHRTYRLEERICFDHRDPEVPGSRIRRAQLAD